MQNKKPILTALFTALCCVATIAIVIPSPMNGYLNMGDCFVLLSGWLLGPVYGAFAAGVGSMLADIFTGYFLYAPGTLVIKALSAVIAALLCRRGAGLGKRAVSAVLAEIWMIAGYFAYAWLILGNGLPAAAGIPGNAIQGVFGAVAGVALCTVIWRNTFLRKHFTEGKTHER